MIRDKVDPVFGGTASNQATLPDLLRRLDAVIDYARGALPRLGLEDLDTERKDDDGPISCGMALLHALEHAYLHLGHVQVACQLWRQKEK